MPQEIKKPSPKTVRETGRKTLAQVQEQASKTIAEIEAQHDKNLIALSASYTTAMKQAQDAKTSVINVSQETVDVLQKDADALRQALAAAEQKLWFAKGEHLSTVNTATTQFKDAAAKIEQRNHTRIMALSEDRDYQIMNQNLKVDKTKEDNKAAYWAEVRATLDYDAFVVKDTAARIGNGFITVGCSLSKVFKAGYSKDTKVKVPKRVQERQGNDNQPGA